MQSIRRPGCHRRRKVCSPSFPPGGETFVHSLASPPPHENRLAAGFSRGPLWAHMREDATLDPIALRPVISGGLLILRLGCRRRKVRSPPFPPGGENFVHFLAPPLPTKTALRLGFRGGPFWARILEAATLDPMALRPTVSGGLPKLAAGLSWRARRGGGGALQETPYKVLFDTFSFKKKYVCHFPSLPVPAVDPIALRPAVSGGLPKMAIA